MELWKKILFAAVAPLLAATSFSIAADRYEGAWGGKTPTSVTFLGKKRLKYCFKKSCKVHAYKGKKGSELSFSAGGKSRVVLKNFGKTYDATYAADGKRVVATALLTAAKAKAKPAKFALTASAPPQVPKKIRPGKPYRASIKIRKGKGVKITKVSFYYSGEGPFPKKFKLKGRKIIAQLFTGNPGTYDLVGEICFRKDKGAEQCVETPPKTIRVR